MSIAVLIPYRPDSPHRERIYQTTLRLWERVDVEVIYSDDGLAGELFSYARGANQARKFTDAQYLVNYSVDALPLPVAVLNDLERVLSGGVPWSVVCAGQHRFTPEQTETLLAGADPDEVGEPRGDICLGRSAVLAVRTDVWDDVRGYDERFIGWGPEDDAFHHVLRTLHPTGCDEPKHGLFPTLWHPPVTRHAFPELQRLWRKYSRRDNPAVLRAFLAKR